MSLFITSLNSGSNGNCFYIGNGTEAVLIDAGLSCRETEKRLQRLGLRMDTIKAIFVSHEHSDHIAGIPVLAKKHCLPVYVTASTRRYCGLVDNLHETVVIQADHPVTIGSLTITGFPKFHDACEPLSFVIEGGEVRIGVFTDIGQPCANVVKHFSKCHAAFLEANYDEQMLATGNYPYHLKKRIQGGKGHLSNTQALALFLEHRPPFMSHLILAHLSANNNCPQLVHELFNQHARATRVIVSSRYEETPLWQVDPSLAGYSTAPLPANRKPAQLSLF